MRTIHEPRASGAGDGLAVYLFFGLPHEGHEHLLDMELRGVEHVHEALVDHGFRVIVDTEGDRTPLLDALYETDPDLDGCRLAGILWSSHGNEDGTIQTCTEDEISYSEIDPDQVSEYLRFMIFSACLVGRHEEDWSAALGGARAFGWGKPITFDRAVGFYTPRAETRNALDDIVEREMGLPRGTMAERWLAIHGQPEEDDGEDTTEYTEIQQDLIAATELMHNQVVSEVRWDGDDGKYMLEVATGEGRTQLVLAYLGAGNDATRKHLKGQQYAYVESQVGPYSDDLDDRVILAANGGLRLGRFQVSAVGDQGDLIVYQSAFQVIKSSPAEFARVMDEAAVQADRLEAELFGTDER